MIVAVRRVLVVQHWSERQRRALARRVVRLVVVTLLPLRRDFRRPVVRKAMQQRQRRG